MRWLLPLLLCGCASSSTFQTADVLRPGGWEVGGDLSGAAIVGDGGDLPIFAMPRGTVRVGLVPRLDLGGSVGIDGVRVQPKIQLTRPGASGPILSVSPGLRLLPLPNPDQGGLNALIGAEEALLLGVPFEERLQLVAVARSAQDVGFTFENRAFLLWAGGSVGLSWQVFPALRVMPEIGAMAPVLVVDDAARLGGDAAVLQVGLGISAGRR